MIRTVAEFDKDQLREALRKAGEKAVCEERARTRRGGKKEPVASEASLEDKAPLASPRADASEADTAGLSTGSDPDDLKCERVQ